MLIFVRSLSLFNVLKFQKKQKPPNSEADTYIITRRLVSRNVEVRPSYKRTKPPTNLFIIFNFQRAGDKQNNQALILISALTARPSRYSVTNSAHRRVGRAVSRPHTRVAQVQNATNITLFEERLQNPLFPYFIACFVMNIKSVLTNQPFNYCIVRQNKNGERTQPFNTTIG